MKRLLLALLLALLAQLAMAFPASTESDAARQAALSRRCSHGKQGACKELAKIAAKQKEAKAKVSPLADQCDLLRKQDGCLEVDKLDSCLELAIAVDDKDEYIRHAAVERLTDRGLLENFPPTEAGVAYECSRGEQGACQRLAMIAATQKEAKAKVSALAEQCNLLGKQDACLELATTAADNKGIWLSATDEYTHDVASERLSDQSLLVKIALNDSLKWDHCSTRAAVGRLTDQSSLVEIAIDDKYPGLAGKAAVERLTAQAALTKVVVDGKYDNIRYAAAGRITDADALEGIFEKIQPQRFPSDLPHPHQTSRTYAISSNCEGSYRSQLFCQIRSGSCLTVTSSSQITVAAEEIQTLKHILSTMTILTSR